MKLIRTLIVAPPGSSPRSRGTSCSHRGRRIDIRFIPALAGNIAQVVEQLQPYQVHPRARGEHGGGERNGRCQLGSSPRSRGTFTHILQYIVDNRFIPALAGNMSDSERMSGVPPGSSPRSRGTSSRARSGKSGFLVHPRARGEHCLY